MKSPHQILYELLLPSSGCGDVTLWNVARRDWCVVWCCDDLEPECRILLFEAVEALKCTFYESCAFQQFTQAYDRVVDVGASDGLLGIAKREPSSPTLKDDRPLRHLMIYFDDGPGYEFICRGFRVEASSWAETDIQGNSLSKWYREPD